MTSAAEVNQDSARRFQRNKRGCSLCPFADRNDLTSSMRVLQRARRTFRTGKYQVYLLLSLRFLTTQALACTIPQGVHTFHVRSLTRTFHFTVRSLALSMPRTGRPVDVNGNVGAGTVYNQVGDLFQDAVWGQHHVEAGVLVVLHLPHGLSFG